MFIRIRPCPRVPFLFEVAILDHRRAIVASYGFLTALQAQEQMNKFLVLIAQWGFINGEGE